MKIAAQLSLLWLPLLACGLKLDINEEATGCGPARGLFQVGSKKGGILLETDETAKPAHKKKARALKVNDKPAAAAEAPTDEENAASDEEAVEPAQTSNLPKFYIHDFVNVDGMLKCYHSKKHTTPGIDEMDHHVMPDTAEHLVDIWLIDQLRKHPQRTKNADEAQYHIAGTPIFLSYAASRFQHCGDHESRMHQMVNGIRSSKYFKSRKFVVIATAPDAKRVLTEPLIGLAKSGGVILATADKDYTSVKPFPRKVVIPYKSHFKLEANAWNETAEIPDTAHRSVSFMFHGDIKKGKRAVLQKLKQQLPESNIQDHDFQGIGQPGMNKIGDQSVQTYLNSKFCLIAEGSTPTSRRLFDALAGGCVPVMMGGVAGLKRNMPFTKTLDWSQLVFFGGDLDCVKTDLGGTTNFLNKLLEEPEDKIDGMRKRARKAFTGALSYKGPGIVDAILRELPTV